MDQPIVALRPSYRNVRHHVQILARWARWMFAPFTINQQCFYRTGAQLRFSYDYQLLGMHSDGAIKYLDCSACAMWRCLHGVLDSQWVIGGGGIAQVMILYRRQLNHMYFACVQCFPHFLVSLSFRQRYILACRPHAPFPFPFPYVEYWHINIPKPTQNETSCSRVSGDIALEVANRLFLARNLVVLVIQ